MTSTNGKKETDGSKKRSRDDTIEVVWEHYRNFVDSLEQEEEQGGGDIDELNEIIEHLKDVQPATSLGKTCEELLPVLASVAHYQLASFGISQTVDTIDADASDFDEATILEHLQSSVHYFPLNCSTWSMGANYARIQQVVPPAVIAKWYQKAAEYASTLRRQTIDMLEQEDEEEEEADDKVKEWLELLVLVGMIGSEFVTEEEGGDDEDIEVETEEDEEKEEEVTGHFSASSVEATSRFMAAMLLSTLDKHDDAAKELSSFDLTHRLHPNVWKNKTSSDEGKEGGPAVFTDGVLPASHLEQLLEAFGPNASFWKESDYAHRGYYSFFFDIPDEPSNLIEQIICTHLLPLAKQSLEDGDEEIVGAEWWTHIRPIEANLGHNLHFDTDESLLHHEGNVTHPILSSVLYLTTGKGTAGSTIVLDQMPDSTEAAKKCWTCTPQDNSFMVFPGNMLHGVLPCPGQAEGSVDNNADVDDKLNWEYSKKKKDISTLPHRLTFMVGFWTRSVPEKMKNRQEYGPCGPLPEEAAWVKQISTFPKQAESAPTPTKSPLPCLSPAWEELETTTEEPLEIPMAIDHRFFVKGAPHCFRASLFEKDEDSQC